MTFILESSSLPVLIPLGPKYSPQNSVFKYLSLLTTLMEVFLVSESLMTVEIKSTWGKKGTKKERKKVSK